MNRKGNDAEGRFPLEECGGGMFGLHREEGKLVWKHNRVKNSVAAVYHHIYIPYV